MSRTTSSGPRSRVAAKGRHVSIRVPEVLHERLEAVAQRWDEPVSQSARRLLIDGLDRVDGEHGQLAPPGSGGRISVDAALDRIEATLDRLLTGRTLAAPGRSDPTAAPEPAPITEAVESPPAPTRSVDVMKAKTSLSRLLTDVARGEEIVITHAGAPRARLVPMPQTR